MSKQKRPVKSAADDYEWCTRFLDWAEPEVRRLMAFKEETFKVARNETRLAIGFMLVAISVLFGVIVGVLNRAAEPQPYDTLVAFVCAGLILYFCALSVWATATGLRKSGFMPPANEPKNLLPGRKNLVGLRLDQFERRQKWIDYNHDRCSKMGTAINELLFAICLTPLVAVWLTVWALLSKLIWCW